MRDHRLLRVRRGFTIIVVALALVASSASAVENLASSRAGGRLVYFSSQFNDTDWNAEHLIDGSPNNGWAGTSGGAQSIVIAFKNDGLATVEDIVVNPYTREGVDTWVKKIEVQVSTTYPFKGFQSVGTLELSRPGHRPGAQPRRPGRGPLREGEVPAPTAAAATWRPAK